MFFVGCARSGTTLLKRVADAHRDLAVVRRETHWIPRVHRQGVGIDDRGRVTPELLGVLAAHPQFRHLKIELPEVEAMIAERPTYAELVSRLFDRYGEACGKRLVGDKTPGYVQSIDLFHELWPQARFVHLIRDGRDVCLSFLEWSRSPRNVGRYPTWQEDPVSTVAVLWNRHVRCGIDSYTRLPEGFGHEIRYEDLVADPGREAERLCSFLGLPFDASMLMFHEGKTKSDPGLSAKKAWLPVTAGLRDWRSQMPAAAVERFESIAGELLDELGYPRACPRPSAGALEHAARIKETCDSWRAAKRARASGETGAPTAG